METVMPHWLTKQATQNPHKIAIETETGECMTFHALKEASQERARQLSHYGMQKGDHIGMLMTNSLDMVITIHALSYLQATIVFLNTRLTKNELQYQIDQADVSSVISECQLIKEKAIENISIYLMKEIKESEENKDVVLAKEINLSDPFTMMFTSGTTGFPKAVIHTYGNHLWSAMGSLLNLKYYNDDKWLLPLPMFHVGGFSILVRSVIYGMSVFLIHKFEAEKVFQIIEKEKITIASFVTLMLQQYVSYLDGKSASSSLRTILLGGGSIPTSLLDDVQRNQLPVYQSYGMTETSSQIVTLNEQNIDLKHGSAGSPLFPAQVKIDAQDKQVGEILVKGPMVFEGYYKNDKANEESFLDGWFKTGDLGYLDDDGFLYVVDRRSDLIISGGENIYPTEIEHVILELAGIKELAVVGRRDEKWGQIPVAYIVLEDDSLNQSTIEAHVEKKLASFKRPKAYHFIESLPRTASNKIMRHKLSE